MKKWLAVLLSFMLLVPTLGMLPPLVMESSAEELIEWTNGAVTATVTAHDVASAGGYPSDVLYYSKDGVNWQESNQLVYTVAEGNPTIGNTTIYVKDDVGNVVSYPIVINNIDVNKPTGSLTSSITTPTNQDITITCNASDDQSGVKEYSFDGGVTWSASNTNIVGVNGSYTCHIRDNAGNIGNCSIVVSNIDKVAPIISSIEPSSTEPFNCNGEGDLHIVVNASDNVGGLGLGTNCMVYALSENDSVHSDGYIPLGFSTRYNGTYEICVVDLAGNPAFASVTVDNIDNELPVVRSITSSCTSLINQDVMLTVDAYDVTTVGYTKEVGIDISCNALTKVSDSVFKAEANGTYAIKVTDKAKNSISTNFTVSNIDKVKPHVGYTLDTSWTNEDLTCSFNVSDDRGLCKVKLPNGSVQTFSSPTAHNASLEDGARDIPIEPYTDAFEYTFSVNGSYTFEVYDLAGNMESVTVVVSNIDKVAPEVTLNNTDFSFTNSDIVLSFTPSDDNSDFDANYVSYDGGLSYSGNTAYTVSENTTVNVCVKDKAGNIKTLDVPITNIDKLNPVIDSIGKSTDTLTKDSITLTVNAHDLGVSGLADNTYKFSGEFEFNSSNSRVVSSNGTYTFTVLDKAGNISTQSITVSNIDNLKPTVSVSPSSRIVTNQTVLLSVSAVDADATELSAKSGLGTNPYSYDSGSTWVSQPVLEVSRNDTYNIWVRDAVGNIEKTEFIVSWIDTELPVFTQHDLSTTELCNTDITLEYDATDNVEIPTSGYSYDGGLTWVSKGVRSISECGNYNLKVRDTAGNIASYDFSVSNIDKASPSLKSYVVSTTNLTNRPIALSLVGEDVKTDSRYAYSEDSDLMYSFNNEEYTRDTSVSVTSNGIYSIRVKDKAGNVGYDTITINNIDKILPVIDSIEPSDIHYTNTNITLRVTSHDDRTPECEVSINGSEWSTDEEYEIEENGTYTIRVRDEAGNIATSSIDVTNIDKVAPSGSITLNEEEWVNHDIEGTIIVSDDVGLLSVKLYEGSEAIDSNLLLDNTFTEADAKLEVSVNHMFSSNGSFLMIAKDYSGNEVSEVIELSKIDKIEPQFDSISADISSLTNSGITLSVKASDSFGEIDYIECPDGTVITETEFTYPVGSNGTYTFKVFDKAGNSASGSIDVSNIDTIAPNVVITPSTVEWTDEVVLSVTSSDNEGVGRLVLPDGASVTEGSSEYTVTQNGTYRFVAFDNAGNSYAVDVIVSNIDITPPSLGLGLTRTYWVDGDNTIVVSASDDESGLADEPYSYDGGNTWVSSNNHTISEGGNYSVSVRDKLGNISTLSIDAVMSPIEVVFNSVVEDVQPMVEEIPEEVKDVPVSEVLEVIQPNIDNNSKAEDKGFFQKELEMFVDWISTVEIEDAVKTTAVVTSSALLIFILIWTLSCAVLLKMGRGVKYYAMIDNKKTYLGKCLCRRKKGIFTIRLSRKNCSRYIYTNDIKISFGKSFTSVNNGKTVSIRCGELKTFAIVGDDTTFSF